jgi:hypothetical protein
MKHTVAEQKILELAEYVMAAKDLMVVHEQLKADYEALEKENRQLREDARLEHAAGMLEAAEEVEKLKQENQRLISEVTYFRQIAHKRFDEIALLERGRGRYQHEIAELRKELATTYDLQCQVEYLTKRNRVLYEESSSAGQQAYLDGLEEGRADGAWEVLQSLSVLSNEKMKEFAAQGQYGHVCGASAIRDEILKQLKEVEE